MKVAIAANAVGESLKDCVKKYLTDKEYEMVDMSGEVGRASWRERV